MDIDFNKDLTKDLKLKIDLKLYVNPKNNQDFYPGYKLRVAIGNFDGVHQGHRYIIQKITSGSKESKSMVITFRSYNHSIFTMEQKIEALFNLGVDYVMVLPENIKSIRKDEFLDFLRYFSIELIAVGKDFRFGYQREGSLKDLEKVSYVFESSYILDSSSNIISSTRIRSKIREHSIENSRELLGYTPYIQGALSHGVHRATSLGFPTINIEYPGTIYDQGVYIGAITLYQTSYRKESLPQGITINIGDSIRININEYKFYPYIYNPYIKPQVQSQSQSDFKDRIYNAIIHIGSRPTLRKVDPGSYPVDSRVVEAHILDSSFSMDEIKKEEFKDMYGRFYLLNFLAKEKVFSDEGELKVAISTYVKKAKNFFSLKV